MKILPFYESVLKSIDIVDTGDEGMLSAFYNDDYNPVTVGKKRLVLPTPEILRAGMWDNRVAFHPMCEKITRTESPVLKLLKDAISLRTDRTVEVIADALMHTAASPALHKNIGGPKAAEYLKRVPEVNERTYKSLKKILTATKQPKFKLVNYYLKHGSKGTDTAARTCVVSFPIFDELLDPAATTVFDVKIDKKDKKNILSLFEYIFGDVDTRENYSYGSNNPEAPYFHALLTSFYKMSTRLNLLLEKHKKHVPDADKLSIDVSWCEALDEFALFRGMIPALDGNEGSIAKVEEAAPVVKDEAAVRTFNRPTPTEAVEAKRDLPWNDDAPRRPEPTRRPEPAPGGKVGLSDFFAERNRPAERPQSDNWGRPEQQPRGRDGFRDSGNTHYDRDSRRTSYDRDDRDGFRGGRGGGRHI